MNALLRLVTWVIALALVALPVVAVLNGWIGAEQWPLRKLRVTGEFERVDETQLRAALVPHARRGFFAVDLDRAQAAVAALPWVARADVRKRWPDVLEVTVVEHRPFARWGRDKVLSTEGRLFVAREAGLPATLPRFEAPDARVAEVVALYNESRALFAPIGLQVREVELDRRGSWSLVLDSGTEVVLGRSEARARLARFTRLLPRLLAGGQRLMRADLRYTNGFALAWRPGTGRRESEADKPASPATTPLPPQPRVARAFVPSNDSRFPLPESRPTT